MSKHDENVLPVPSIIGFLGLFAVLVAVAIAKKTGVIDYNLAKRCVGIVLGLMLIGAGNLLPKFRLFDAPGRDPVKALAAERIAGWTFVLAGAAYVAVWTLVPTTSVMLLSSIVGLSAFALVGINFLCRAGGTRLPVTRPQATEATVAKRILLGTILLSLGWGIAIFLVDHLWGDTASMWAGVLYPIVVSAVIGLASAQLFAGRELRDNEPCVQGHGAEREGEP